MSVMSTAAAINAATFHRDRASSPALANYWQKVIDGIAAKNRVAA